jgi:hypothetical protein
MHALITLAGITPLSTLFREADVLVDALTLSLTALFLGIAWWHNRSGDEHKRNNDLISAAVCLFAFTFWNVMLPPIAPSKPAPQEQQAN